MKIGYSFHVHIDIAHALTLSDKKLKDLLCYSDSKESLTPNEVRNFLIEELRKGYKYFTSCDNRKEDGQCAGHKATWN